MRKFLVPLMLFPLVACETDRPPLTPPPPGKPPPVDTSPPISKDQSKLITSELDQITAALKGVGKYELDLSQPHGCSPHLTAYPSSVKLTLKLAKTTQTDLMLGANIPLPWAVVTPQLTATNSIVSTRTVALPINLNLQALATHNKLGDPAPQVPPEIAPLAEEVRSVLEVSLQSFLNESHNPTGACEHYPTAINFTVDFDVNDTGTGSIGVVSIVSGSAKLTSTDDSTQTMEVDYAMAGSAAIAALPSDSKYADTHIVSRSQLDSMFGRKKSRRHKPHRAKHHE